jgi:IS30 family transposase
MSRKGYHHMTREERCQLQTLKSIGKSQNQIAQELGFNRATISREIARNSGIEGYNFKEADEISKRRKSSASEAPKKMKGDLKALVLRRLEYDWSPDQISGRLRRRGKFISHVTIYKYIWDDKAKGGLLYQHLRHGGKKYKFKKEKQSGIDCIPNRVDISQRPGEVEEKLRIGHWEGDTVISSGSRCALLTHVERVSKIVKLNKIGRKTMENTNNGTHNSLKKLKKFVDTITYDNGKEFSGHEKIAKKLDAKIYFARPYKSCDRGLNEHTNGLIRQYLPKKVDFADISDDYIQFIENRLNYRPRKVLQYRTPIEVFFGYETLSTNKCTNVALQI